MTKYATGVMSVPLPISRQIYFGF